MEERINFETAKLAKEKVNYNENSHYYFSNIGNEYSGVSAITYDCYHRPIQSQLQKHLRDIYTNYI